jgi:hypothetical protein
METGTRFRDALTPVIVLDCQAIAGRDCGSISQHYLKDVLCDNILPYECSESNVLATGCVKRQGVDMEDGCCYVCCFVCGSRG